MSKTKTIIMTAIVKGEVRAWTREAEVKIKRNANLSERALIGDTVQLHCHVRKRFTTEGEFKNWYQAQR